MSAPRETPLTAWQRGLLENVAAHATQLAARAQQIIGGEFSPARDELAVLQAEANVIDQRLTDLLWTVDQ